ncbi:TPA: glycoside hydrolase family 32 protein, partial [Enterococcus faecium]|nr:glycoside hydrolase family 32 protein [Enterococcus faecium]
MLQKLLKANEFIEKNAQTVNQEYRNKFHLMAPIGWMNDPNGFVYYQEEYHLFY